MEEHGERGKVIVLVRERKEQIQAPRRRVDLNSERSPGWLGSISKINGGAEKSTRRDSTGSTVTRQQQLAALPPLPRERETDQKGRGDGGGRNKTERKSLSLSPVGSLLPSFLPGKKEMAEKMGGGAGRGRMDVEDGGCGSELRWIRPWLPMPLMHTDRKSVV